MIQISKNLIDEVITKFYKLQDKIDSEDFHSGAGCGCKDCVKRNYISATLLNAKNFENQVLQEKEHIEAALRSHLK